MCKTTKKRANVSTNSRAPSSSTTPASPSRSSSSSSRPSLVTIWWTAARPHTLTASLCPCLVSFAANYDALTSFNRCWLLLYPWILFCITIQLGTNLHNDYADFVQGADCPTKRVGQARATAQGWLSPQQTCQATCGVLAVTFVSGLHLIVQTQQTHNVLLWFLILSSIFNAFAYTGGPFPLGYIGLGNWSIAYSGLGDIFVFLYFGLVATLMIPYLLQQQQKSSSLLSELQIDMYSQWLYAIQVGFLAMNILVVNNLRDRHSDVTVGKRTTAVRFGRPFSLWQYRACLILTYALVVVDAVSHQYQQQTTPSYIPLIRLLPLLTVPLAKQEVKAVTSLEGAALNKHVGGAAKVQLAFSLSLAASLIVAAASYQ